METIAMWPSVRKGERENIFPFQEQADVMFNSALVYELAVLKVYAEPLLFGIERDCRLTGNREGTCKPHPKQDRNKALTWPASFR